MRTKFLILLTLSFSFVFAQKTVQLEDIWGRFTFYASGVNGLNSMQDGLHYTTLNKNVITKYSYETGKEVSVLLSSKMIEEQTGEKVAFSGYAFSANEQKVLLTTEEEKLFRYSTKAIFYVYDFVENTLTKVDEEKVRYATLSPAGNKVAFVKANNLFVKDLDNGKTVQVTMDGRQNTIINGATDWVYEEEFAFDKAFFWSPGGDYIAYYRFDESGVPEFSMDMYGKALYPSQSVFKYPKAGEPNSVVTAHIYTLETGAHFPVLTDEDYEYIPRIKWTNDPKEIVIYTMNRHQNELTLHKVDAATGEKAVLYKETDEAYIEISDDIRFLKDGSFIWSSDMNGFNHLYHISNKGKVKKQITTGEWEVISFYGMDEKTKTLYYQSNEQNVYERNVYSISVKGSKKKRLTPKDGVNNANFSDGFKYFINTSSAFNQPPHVTLNKADGSEIRVLKDNKRAVERIAQYTMADKEFFTLTTEEGNELSASIMKPADFDETKKYPVLMYVYGGPGHQLVLNQYNWYNDMWFQHLASLGYIIVNVDNRGTGGKGREFRKMTYLELGKYEVEDQIASAKYLASLPYVDGERIGIWGWSYGGFMSSNCLFKGNDVFKAAIAVAPVTNWRFYDNIYTERYMRTPQENADGYDMNSPINYVNDLEGNFLLIHGGGDDNVHVQNSMRMVNELIKANKQFDYFMYPDRDHSIMGGGARVHLYETMTSFILEKCSGLTFNRDGTRMYVLGIDTDDVETYVLSTPYDVSTATYITELYDVRSEDAAAASVKFSTNGLKMFVTGSDMKYNKTPQQLSLFLQHLCKQEKLECGPDGMYKLLKK